jgi:hypothetical protein
MIRDVRLFLSSLTKVNTEIAFYIFGALDQNNNFPERAFPPDREESLGAEMVEVGQALQERARERRVPIEGASLPFAIPSEQQNLGELL